MYSTRKKIMYLNKIKRIVIFGGGTSGWLTAAFLSKNLVVPTEIVLIEDSTLGPIGVGEGTQPYTAKFLSRCGIHPKAWMKDSNASFKYGVELIGWNDEPYFVDNDNPSNTVMAEDFYTSDYFIDKPYSEFAKWHPAYRLAKQNICQKFDDYLDINYAMGTHDFGAVHFSAYDIIKTIKNLIIDKITYVDTKIVSITQNENGIDKLIDQDGDSYSGDLFIDCTGFKSLLLEQELKIPFRSFNKWLLNDSAVVLQTQYKNHKEECFPYTKATAMNAGWMFTIPIYTRTGNGYIYSSKYLTKEQAEKELREKLGEYMAPAKHLEMKCGAHDVIAYKNVCAVGLSAGFVEPLEATGITFTTAAVASIANSLNEFKNVWGQSAKNRINFEFAEMSSEIFTFVWAHYHFCTKNDTPYWQEIRSQKIEDTPPVARQILDKFLPIPQRFILPSPTAMFNIVQWFSMLKAGGAYDNVKPYITDKQRAYAEYFIESNNSRLALAEKTFPNHYEYLRNWYRHDPRYSAS